MSLAFVLFGLTAAGVVRCGILVLAALLGITNAVDMPTRQSFVVEMVGREDMPTRWRSTRHVQRGPIAGPAIAGLTIGAFDISIAFLINGLSFLAVIVAYALMRERTPGLAASARGPSHGEVGRLSPRASATSGARTSSCWPSWSGWCRLFG